MGFEQSRIILESADTAQSPLPESASFRSGNGAGPRPPSTGMLPEDLWENRAVSCLLIVMEPGSGRTLVARALIDTERPGKQAPIVLYCIPDAVEEYARAAHLHLAIIEDRGKWRSNAKQIAACGQLKRIWAPEPIILVLGNGPRLFGRRAPSPFGADIRLPADIAPRALGDVIRVFL
jgi:hypothetical protein